MGIKIYVLGGLTLITKGQNLFEVNGKTVGECLKNFISLMPKMKDILFFKSGEGLAPRSHIQVFVKEKSTDADILAKQVEDGDEIHIKKNIQ